MVENPGKTLHADTCRPVNTPETVKIEDDASGEPLAVRLKRRQAVLSIEDKWRLDDEWWRSGPIARLYYNVLLASGQRMILYKDLITGNWYQQDY